MAVVRKIGMGTSCGDEENEEDQVWLGQTAEELRELFALEDDLSDQEREYAKAELELLELCMSCEGGADANVGVARRFIWRRTAVECGGGEVSQLLVRKRGDRDCRRLGSGVRRYGSVRASRVGR